MKISNDIEKIFSKYDLKAIELSSDYKNIYDFLRKNPTEAKKYQTKKNDGYFIKKYCDYIPKGWYGFDVGTPIIPEWMDIIDEILEICTENDQDFEIHQIKLKYGAICFYVYSKDIEDIHDVELLIMNKLYDKTLIY
jgi:hypothetical protein